MIDILLGRLEDARATGHGRWIACCPAHEDRHPSLSVRELDDGRVLVCCFAGCGAADVLAAVGLDFTALYPSDVDTRPVGRRRRHRATLPPIDALRLVEAESILVATLACDLGRGERATPEIRAQLFSAAGRIAHALEVCHDYR